MGSPCFADGGMVADQGECTIWRVDGTGPSALVLARQWQSTVCPRSSDPFYIVTYYIKWVTTSWTDGSCSQRIPDSVALQPLIYIFNP